MWFKRTLTTLGERPFDIAIAIVLFFAGVNDLFFGGYPPTISNVIDSFILDIYGLFLVLGSSLFLISIFSQDKPWKHRLERAGLTILIGALTAFSFLLFYGIREYAAYQLIEAFGWIVAINICSIARVVYLGKRGRCEGCLNG